MACLFAARLSAVSDVLLLGHWPQQMAQLRQHGLWLAHQDGRSTHHTFATVTAAAAAAPVDVALLLVKSWQTKRAAQEAAQLLKPNGTAVTLQNGLGNVETLAAAVGATRAALGVTTLGATLERPGYVRHAGAGDIYLGQAAETETAVAALAGVLRQAGLPASTSGNVLGLAWSKLAINAAINPLTALLRQPNGYLADNAAARRLMMATAREVQAVTAAWHIDLTMADAADAAWQVAQATAVNQSSMLQDVRRGAPTEIEAICGAVVANGRLPGVPTPLNAAWLRLVQQSPVRIFSIEQLQKEVQV